jgi:hypothetical protein
LGFSINLYSLGLVVGPVRREEKWFNGANAEESNSQLLIGQSKPGDRPGGDEYGSETRWFEFGSHPYTFMPTGSQQVSGWKAQTKVAYQGFATESPTPFRPIPIC